MPCGVTGSDVCEGGEAEEGERGDLQGNTRHHEVVAEFLSVVVVHRRRSDSTSDGLDHERKQITRDKDPRVPAGWNARVLRAKAQRDMLQYEVDGGRVERRTEDQAADLDLEANLAEGVLV